LRQRDRNVTAAIDNSIGSNNPTGCPVWITNTRIDAKAKPHQTPIRL
jgi:hypothetical protein